MMMAMMEFSLSAHFIQFLLRPTAIFNISNIHKY
jgi:hypothetical protein